MKTLVILIDYDRQEETEEETENELLWENGGDCEVEVFIFFFDPRDGLAQIDANVRKYDLY